MRDIVSCDIGLISGNLFMPRSDIHSELDRHGILPTSQRLEIAGVLLDKPQHLSADQIIDSLRAGGSAVSKATVYNTLNLFAERGLIKECVVDPQRSFYDSTTKPHHHFYDMDTGELTDIPHDDIRLAELPPIPEGSSLESVEVVVKVRSQSAKNLA